MKKLLLVCVALFVVAGLAVPAAQAQQCFKWVAFCDGIQVDSVGAGRIESQWYHWDCTNNTPMTHGVIRSGVPNACPGGNGNALIACQSAQGCPVGDWVFTIDSLDGTLDMNNGGPAGLTCWIDELAYTLTMGACTGAPQQGRPAPQVSSVQ